MKKAPPAPATQLEGDLSAIPVPDGLRLVGVSAGRDSTALWHALLRLGQKVAVCHVNHGWRGEDSDADEAWVEEKALRWGCPLEVHRLADDPPANETEARKRRLACFLASARKLGAESVVLAHHAEDQAETMMLALLRGAGLRGAAGMRASRRLAPDSSVSLDRPLLKTRRAVLEDHLRFFNLDWREDKTNDLRFTPRNRLRHDVWPRLEAVWGRDPLSPLLRFSAAARRDEECLATLAEGLFHATHREEKLHAALLRGQPPALQLRVLELWFRRQGIPVNSQTLERVSALLRPGPGPAATSLPQKKRARRTNGWLWIEEAE